MMSTIIVEDSSVLCSNNTQCVHLYPVHRCDSVMKICIKCAAILEIDEAYHNKVCSGTDERHVEKGALKTSFTHIDIALIATVIPLVILLIILAALIVRKRKHNSPETNCENPLLKDKRRGSNSVNDKEGNSSSPLNYDQIPDNINKDIDPLLHGKRKERTLSQKSTDHAQVQEGNENGTLHSNYHKGSRSNNSSEDLSTRQHANEDQASVAVHNEDQTSYAPHDEDQASLAVHNQSLISLSIQNQSKMSSTINNEDQASQVKNDLDQVSIAINNEDQESSAMYNKSQEFSATNSKGQVSLVRLNENQSSPVMHEGQTSSVMHSEDQAHPARYNESQASPAMHNEGHACPASHNEGQVMPKQSAADRHPNRDIYDILRRIEWVQGYISDGHSITVYTDLTLIDTDIAYQELAFYTGQPRTKFHLKHEK